MKKRTDMAIIFQDAAAEMNLYSLHVASISLMLRTSRGNSRSLLQVFQLFFKLHHF